MDQEEISCTFLVHTVKIKPITKAKIAGKLMTSGISNVVIASIYLTKTRPKKMIMIIIIITSNRKNIYYQMKKGDVRIVKCFSKK